MTSPGPFQPHSSMPTHGIRVITAPVGAGPSQRARRGEATRAAGGLGSRCLAVLGSGCMKLGQWGVLGRSWGTGGSLGREEKLRWRRSGQRSASGRSPQGRAGWPGAPVPVIPDRFAHERFLSLEPHAAAAALGGKRLGAARWYLLLDFSLAAYGQSSCFSPKRAQFKSRCHSSSAMED
ncbi:unnamed protein product [Lepidochelys olivacea]